MLCGARVGRAPVWRRRPLSGCPSLTKVAKARANVKVVADIVVQGPSQNGDFGKGVRNRRHA